MNNIKSQSSGFSLMEVLVAILLLSVMALGLTQYHQTIIAQHKRFHHLLKADRIAFQMLDNYPNTLTNINLEEMMPKNWQYDLSVMNYARRCQMVVIKITITKHQGVQQKRVICR